MQVDQSASPVLAGHFLGSLGAFRIRHERWPSPVYNHIPSLFTIGASNERVQELGLDCCSIFERTLPDLGNIGRSRL